MNSMNNETLPPCGTGTKLSQLLARPLVQMVLIASLALLAYANTFQVPFIFDDESSITENGVIRELGHFFMQNEYDYLPNRFIGYLTFALNYRFGGLNVVGYHVVNLVVHIGNGLLVYALVRLTLRTPFFRRDPECRARGTEAGPPDSTLLAPRVFIPFCAALLFVCHPLQTQAVTYIVQRLTSLAALFFLAALASHLRWRLAREAGAPFASRAVLPFWLLSLLCAVLAMKTKEIAFTLPMVVLLYECCFFGRPGLRRLLSLLPMLSTAAIIPFAMLSLDKPIGKILSDVTETTVVQASLSRWEYLCTQFSVIVTYLRLLLLPVNQNLDYDYPVNHSLLEARTLLSLALLLAILGLAAWLFYRSAGAAQRANLGDRTGSGSRLADPHLRLAAFGILWFFLTLGVESSVIPITDVIFEHRVYLPSVGIFMAIAALAAAALRRRPGSGRVAVAGLAVAATVLCTATYARNGAWQSEETLWKDVAAKSPAKARPHTNLGIIYAKRDRVEDSIGEFEAAIALAPEQPETLSNMVLLYVSAGRRREAAAACASLLDLDPGMEKPLKLYQILRMPEVDNEALLQVRNACRTTNLVQGSRF